MRDTQATFTRGFTIVEILVAIAVLGLVAFVIMSALQDYASRQRVQAEVIEVTRSLEEQRSKALAALDDAAYGVAFSSTSMTLFVGDTYSAGASSNIVIPLQETRATLALSGGATELYFEKRTGEASATGTIALYSALRMSTTTLTIYASGNLE